jgi:hypothetical protein
MNKPGLLLVGARSGQPIDERFASQSSRQQPEAKLSLAGFEPYLTASDRSKAKPTKSIDRNKEKISSKRKNKIDLTRDLARIKTNRSKGTHTHIQKHKIQEQEPNKHTCAVLNQIKNPQWQDATGDVGQVEDPRRPVHEIRKGGHCVQLCKCNGGRRGEDGEALAIAKPCLDRCFGFGESCGGEGGRIA